MKTFFIALVSCLFAVAFSTATTFAQTNENDDTLNYKFIPGEMYQIVNVFFIEFGTLQVVPSRKGNRQ